MRSDETKAVLPLVQQLLKADGCVVSCQNGVNEDVIAAAVGVDRTLGCSLVFGAKLLGPSHVKVLAGADVLRSGELRGGPSARLDEIVTLFAACGTSTATYNLMGYRWMKLTLNATGNTLLLLTGLDALALHSREDARQLIIAMAGEILGTALSVGIEPEPVLEIAPEEWISKGAQHNRRLHSALIAHGEGLGVRRLSMVADFEARGRTEVDCINGYIVRKATANGRFAPLNQEVWRMVQAMQVGQRRGSLDALDELTAALRSMDSTP